jgi:hypothetical protein
MDGQSGRDQLRRDLKFPIQAACSAFSIFICQNQLSDRHWPSHARIAQFIRNSRSAFNGKSGLGTELASRCVFRNPSSLRMDVMIPF